VKDAAAQMLVQDLMTAQVHTLGPQANLDEVSDLMRSHRIRHVPIVDAAGQVLGLVTHRDLLGKAFGGGQDLPRSIRQPYLRSIPVAEVMTRRLTTVTPDANLSQVACMMIAKRFGCLPVVEDGRLVGIITATDFVRWVAGC
jgi:CBS domain-containing membrane protein